MSEEQLAGWAVNIGVGGLIVFMLFIVLTLGRDSKAGKFGTFILLIALMVGVLGFCIKLAVQWYLASGMQ